ncbi:hypothetical protein AB1207_14545 [Kineococcus endophyticus]|uniref:Regulatory LuxR family protein n=1 Tax=Kineococcus endophyticus TaxID=1181883 RepID=A0ABV3P8L8_9ACTN
MGRDGHGAPLDAADQRLVDLLRAGASGSEAAVHLGLSAREVATRLRGLRDRWGVTSTRRLLDVLPDGPRRGTPGPE